MDVEFMQYPSGGSRISQTGGATVKGGGRQPIIWPNVPENCMKMKKLIQEGDALPCIHQRIYLPFNALTRQWKLHA